MDVPDNERILLTFEGYIKVSVEVYANAFSVLVDAAILPPQTVFFLVNR